MSAIGTPEMYGAVGNGIADDSVAIKKAFVSHSVIQFDAKTYAVRGMLGVPSFREIRGAGKDKTIIKLMDNAPFGYAWQVYVFQNTFFRDTLKWRSDTTYYGGPDGVLLGSGSISNDVWYGSTDADIKDEWPSSSVYHAPQYDGGGQIIAKPYGGLGLLAYQGLGALRKNVTIKDMTIDCNFNNQTRHSSYNWKGNPELKTNSYIPEFSWSVRPTIQAIGLQGEDITYENIKVINYGYGVPFLNTGSYNGSTIIQHKINYIDKYPYYIENFALSINGSITQETLSGAYVDDTNHSFDAPNSRLLKNKIINCEVSTPGNVDLMNYRSNTSAIVCTNQSLYGLDTSVPTDSEIFRCTINPGYYPQYVTASLWNDANNNSKYLDEIKNSTIKPTNAANLFSWFTGSKGKQTGSNGQIAISNWPGYPKFVLKKISGSWFPNGCQTSVYRHWIFGGGANKISNCTVRNTTFGYYHDTYKFDATVENNRFVDVQVGVFLNTGGLGMYNPTYKNLIIKDNYIKLSEQMRGDGFFGSSVGVLMSNNNVTTAVEYNNWKSNETAKIVNHHNVIIENNIIDLPISSSKTLYEGGGGGVTETKPFEFYKYGYYSGINFTSDHSGSKYNFYRNFVIKNNKFINFSQNTTSSFGNTNYNAPISTLALITASNETMPPSKTRNFYRDKVLGTYVIEGNTFNSPVYPSTASLCKINLGISVPNVGVYGYPINQVSKIDEGQVKGNLTVNGTVTAGSKSFLIDHPTKPGKKLQYGSLESPYHGIRLTGKSKANKTGVKVDLPDYTFALVKKEDVNIQLTPVKCNKLFYVSNIDVDNNCFYVICDQSDEELEFYWDFTAIRKDVSDLQTEF